MIVVYSAIIALMVAVGTWGMRRTWKGRIRLPLPPGPPRKLFLGNLRDLPKHGCKQWEHWYKHKALYGKSAFPPILLRIPNF